MRFGGRAVRRLRRLIAGSRSARSGQLILEELVNVVESERAVVRRSEMSCHQVASRLAVCAARHELDLL